MVRGTGIPETNAIDEITAHDGTATAITEEEMKGGNETRDETDPGETATGIAIIDTRIVKDVLRMPMSDDIVLRSPPYFHPMVRHVCEGPPTPIGKRARYLLLCAARLHRIGKSLVY